MKAFGGRGICEASLRLSLELVRVGPSAGELGGDMMNMVGGGGGPVETEKIGSSQGVGLGSVANVKLMQGLGLSTNGGMSSKHQAPGTRGQREGEAETTELTTCHRYPLAGLARVLTWSTKQPFSVCEVGETRRRRGSGASQRSFVL